MNPVMPDMPIHRPSIRVAKAAALLEVDVSVVYKLVRSGALEAHRVGKRGVRIFADSLRDYQEQRKIRNYKQYEPDQANERRKRPANSRAHEEAITYLQSIGCLKQDSQTEDK